jgi:hypothetical protein
MNGELNIHNCGDEIGALKGACQCNALFCNRAKLRMERDCAYNGRQMTIAPDSDAFSKRLFDFLPRLWLPLLALLCLAAAWRPLGGGDDVWAHAAIGRWMVAHQTVPRETLFLWGAPPQPWVYHSWLSQLSFYALLASGEALGAFLLLGLTALIVFSVFALLWRAWAARIGGVSVWMPLVFSLAVYCSSLRFRARPELFTALFLTLLLLFLIRKTTPEEKPVKTTAAATPGVLWRETIFIFALFVAWTNFHGAVAIGLLMLGAAAICEVAQERGARASWKWLWLFAVGVLAVNFNPYGLDYWQALKPVGGPMFERIDEWKPFWKPPFLNASMLLGELVLVWLALICWLGNSQRRWSQLLWLVLMTALFISARRHLWLLPIVCLSIIAANAVTLQNAELRAEMTLFSRGLARLLATGVLLVTVLFITSSSRFLAEPISPSTPRRATDFFRLKHLGARGRVFNDYENSSFLQWRFGGAPPLYIDLLNAYPDSLLFDYFDIVKATPRGRTMLDEKKVQVVILRVYKPDSSLAKLAKYLNNNKQWQRIYKGADGTIWLRRSKRNAEGGKSEVE